MALIVPTVVFTVAGHHEWAFLRIFEQLHEISNNVVCATSKASDQPAHMRNPVRAFAIRMNIL